MRVAQRKGDPLNHRFQLGGPKRDLVTMGVFSVLVLAAIVYVCLGLTPSSYGVVLTQIGAAEQGPILGVPRFCSATIRSPG